MNHLFALFCLFFADIKSISLQGIFESVGNNFVFLPSCEKTSMPSNFVQVGEKICRVLQKNWASIFTMLRFFPPSDKNILVLVLFLFEKYFKQLHTIVTDSCL